MFCNILKMLFSYKFFTFSQPFSQLPNNFFITKSTTTHTSARTPPQKKKKKKKKSEIKERKQIGDEIDPDEEMMRHWSVFGGDDKLHTATMSRRWQWDSPRFNLSLSLVSGFQSMKLDLKVWVGLNEGWVNGGDGLVRTRDGLTEVGQWGRGEGMGRWSGLHVTTRPCVEGWFWASPIVPSPRSA